MHCCSQLSVIVVATLEHMLDDRTHQPVPMLPVLFDLEPIQVSIHETYHNQMIVCRFSLYLTKHHLIIFFVFCSIILLVNIG